MSAKEFLTDKLKKMSLKFKDIKIRYEYRKSTMSHIVEVIPLLIFNNDEEYMRVEFELEEEFENLFPDEDIVFVSEDSLTEIKNPDLVLGYDYKSIIDNFSYNVEDIELNVNGFTDKVNSCEDYSLAA